MIRWDGAFWRSRLALISRGRDECRGQRICGWGWALGPFIMWRLSKEAGYSRRASGLQVTNVKWGQLAWHCVFPQATASSSKCSCHEREEALGNHHRTSLAVGYYQPAQDSKTAERLQGLPHSLIHILRCYRMPPPTGKHPWGKQSTKEGNLERDTAENLS
jgi:hypothetical protein